MERIMDKGASRRGPAVQGSERRYVPFVRLRYAVVVYRERRAKDFSRRNGWRWARIAWSTHLYILDGWGERDG